MSHDLSGKRSQEIAHPDNSLSVHPADPTKLQRLRQDHMRFTRNPNKKAKMTSQMELQEYAQQQATRFQAQEEYIRGMKSLAEHKGVTSGEIALGKRVPRRYQMGLGGTPERADEYFKQLTKDMSWLKKQDWKKKIYDYNKTKDEEKLSARETFWTIYNQPADDEASASSYQGKGYHSDEQSHDQSASDDEEASASSHQGKGYHSNEQSHDQSASDDEEASASSHQEKEYQSDELSASDDKYERYFSEDYAREPLPGKSLHRDKITEKLNGGCVPTAIKMLLHDQNANFEEYTVTTELGHDSLNGGFDGRRLQTVLNQHGNVLYAQSYALRSVDDLKNALLEGGGYSIGSVIQKEREDQHMVLVDKVTNNHVYIRERAGASKVPISEWKEAWGNFYDLVPQLNTNQSNRGGASDYQSQHHLEYDLQYNPYTGGYNLQYNPYTGGYDPIQTHF